MLGPSIVFVTPPPSLVYALRSQMAVGDGRTLAALLVTGLTNLFLLSLVFVFLPT